MWNLNFITEEHFTEHVKATIQKYDEKLESFDIKKFNSNIIDPIKLIFDKMVYCATWEEIIKNEIFRQRDKSNNNDIGYFHQKIFKYIDKCTVPNTGWDIIYKNNNGILLPDGDLVSSAYIEMKNKHNTMNSSSSGKTYIKMQNQLLADDDCVCFLVEIISKKSQNTKWTATVDSKKVQHKRIRKISIDRFYEMVTGEIDAFYQICMILPKVIENVILSSEDIKTPNDMVVNDLREIANQKQISIAMAVYLLGFSDYIGFH